VLSPGFLLLVARGFCVHYFTLALAATMSETRCYGTKTTLELWQANSQRPVFDNKGKEGQISPHGGEVEIRDSAMQFITTNGKLTNVELMANGWWDKCEKQPGFEHKKTSKMAAYAKECPEGFDMQSAADSSKVIIKMKNFLECFKKTEKEQEGHRHVKVEGMFATGEARKHNVHFTLRFSFADGGTMRVSFVSKRVRRKQHQEQRKDLKRKHDAFMQGDPTPEQMQKVAKFYDDMALEE
tara:strand:+ start:4268 stop:4987 length:720 start_codon:yes stop_codon:yes gene_type:complete